jgi:manganese/zinc/iron transport system substrate-binding protein
MPHKRGGSPGTSKLFDLDKRREFHEKQGCFLDRKLFFASQNIVDNRALSRLTWGGLFVCLNFLIGLLGCDRTVQSNHNTPAGGKKLQVICTTGMVADLVRNVGGEFVNVSALMGAGVDPHLYKPSPGDASRLNAADAIFYSGLHLEGKMTELFERLAAKGKPTFSATDGIAESKLLAAEGGTHDPHVWFDVSLWSEAAGVISQRLCEIDKEHAEYFRERYAEYQTRLAELHATAQREIGTIPVEQRALVTAHDAFRYFGRAYDIEVHGIQGISTESEAGVKQINQLVELLVKRKIKAVFIESSVSDQNVKSLLEGCASRGHALVIGGELYSDAMGNDGTPAGTYEGMVRHNVQTIVAALK